MSDKSKRSASPVDFDADDFFAFDLGNDDDHMAYIDAIFADHEKEQARKSRKATVHRNGSSSKSSSAK